MMLPEKTWYNYLQEHLESKVCLWSVVKFSLMFWLMVDIFKFHHLHIGQFIGLKQAVCLSLIPLKELLKILICLGVISQSSKLTLSPPKQAETNKARCTVLPTPSGELLC